MASALARSVPLNAMCCRRWPTPLIAAGSCRLDGMGKFRRVGAGERNHRDCHVAAHCAGCGDRHRTMRIEQLAAGAPSRRDTVARAAIVDAMTGEETLGRMPFRLAYRQRAGGAEPAHGRGDGGAALALELEEEALEIARHLDIHAGAEARLDIADRHPAICQETRPAVA